MRERERWGGRKWDKRAISTNSEVTWLIEVRGEEKERNVNEVKREITWLKSLLERVRGDIKSKWEGNFKIISVTRR